jgi:hypothetical protein
MLIGVWVLGLGIGPASWAVPLGTVFTYQGRLMDGGSPANGMYDFVFTLHDDSGAVVGGPYFQNEISVTDGYFNVELDFEDIFQGQALWLEIEVKPSGPGGYENLSPWQPIRPAPYALYALDGAGGVEGTGTDNYLPRWNGASDLENSVIYQSDDGKVGIGMIDPTDVLTVGQNIPGVGVSLGTNIMVGDPFAAGITLGADSVNKMDITYLNEGGYGRIYVAFPIAGSHQPLVLQEYGGNVGIGTTSPQQLLHVYGVSNPRILVEAPDTASPEFNLKRGLQAWGLWMDSDNDLNFFHNGNKVTFASGGSVGIGISTPFATSKLHVSGGNVLLDYDSSITMKDGNGFHSGNLIMRDTDSLQLSNIAAGGEIAFYTSEIQGVSTQQMVITGNGNVGISNINPSYTLDVGGPVNLNHAGVGAALRVNGTEALWYNDTYFSWGYGGQNNYFADPVGIGTTNPGSWELYVVGDAYKTAGGSSWNVASDIRLKDVHGPYEYGLEQIRQITPVRFNYKKDNELSLAPDQSQIGLIAQEVQQVIPDAVSETDEGYLSLNMDPVVMAMLNAIKQQQIQIEKQKNDNEQLRAAIQSLTDRISLLERNNVLEERLTKLEAVINQTDILKEMIK